MLNEKEKKKYETIEKVVNGFMTRKGAMFELDMSRQQIYRLIEKYNSEGEKGFIHKNRRKANPNKKDESLIKILEELYLEKYYDFNLEHFYEDYVFGKYDISYDVMLKRFKEDDIISPLASLICGIIGLVATFKLPRKFGWGVFTSILFVLFTLICMLVLAFGSSKYQGKIED